MKPWMVTYKDAKSLVMCGDIHGEFVPLVYEMCVRYGMRDTLVSHTAPSFCEFQSKSGLASWAKEDPELIEECEAERQTMDTLLAHLKRDGHPLERWYYGHFHNSWHSEIDGVWYKMLDIMELLEVPRIIPDGV